MRVLDTQLAKPFQGDVPRNRLTRRYVEGLLGRDQLVLTDQKQTRYRGCGPKDPQRDLSNDAPPVSYVATSCARPILSTNRAEWNSHGVVTLK